MATILELAEHAGVSAENVLRAVRGDPVSEDVSRRVASAVAELGPPTYPRKTAQVLPALERGGGDVDELVERFRAATESLPEGVGTVVYEALRVEVRPVAEHVAQLGSLFERVLDRLERLGDDVEDERRERTEDVELLTELITSGWRSVDRRLARLEQIVGRIESGRSTPREPRLYSVDETAGAARPGD